MGLDELYRVLEGAHVQAQGIVDTIRDPLLVLDDDLIVLSANPAFFKAFQVNRDETVGSAFLALGNGQWDIPELRLLLEQVLPKSASIIKFEVETTFPKLGARTMLVRAQRLEQAGDGRRLLLISLIDATEQRTLDHEKTLLVGEMRHRLKNLLALTAAIARQTRTEGVTAEEFRDSFLGRFSVLSHALETTLSKEPAHLPNLVQTVMEPFLQEHRVKMEPAPDVTLHARQAMPMGMILHELATNAMKYGALSGEGGEVTLSWSVAKSDKPRTHLQMEWIETRGPSATAPSRIGFGTHLIKSAAERDLKGTVVQRFDPEGLRVLLDFPLVEDE